MNELFVLLETSRSIGLAVLCAVALTAGLLVFDRAPGKDTWIEDKARPRQRKAA